MAIISLLSFRPLYFTFCSFLCNILRFDVSNSAASPRPDSFLYINALPLARCSSIERLSALGQLLVCIVVSTSLHWLSNLRWKCTFLNLWCAKDSQIDLVYVFLLWVFPHLNALLRTCPTDTWLVTRLTLQDWSVFLELASLRSIKPTGDYFFGSLCRCVPLIGMKLALVLI